MMHFADATRWESWLAEHNDAEGGVCGPVRLSLTRGALTSTAPAWMGTRRAAW